MKLIYRFSLLLLTLLLPATVSAYEFEVDGIYYDLWYHVASDGITEIGFAAVVLGDNPYTGDVTIPETVAYEGKLYPVEWITENAFSNCTELTSITISDSVTDISYHAFSGCVGLNAITIGKSVTYIGECAFQNCNEVKQLTWNAINCGTNGDMSTSNIEQVILGDDVKVIPNNFASNSKIIEVTIPKSVASIGNYAFQGCTALETLNFNAESCDDFSSYYNPFKDLNISTINIGDSVQRIPAYFAYGLKELTSITIPYSVTDIGRYAFYGCNGLTDLVWNAKNCSTNGSMTTSNIVHVSIGEGVEKIPDYFVSGSKIIEMTIPNSVYSIGNYSFTNCSGLTGDLAIPNSVLTIGDKAFENCNALTCTTIGNSVKNIGRDAFYGCNALTVVNITDIAAWCNISFSNESSNPVYYAGHLYLNGSEVTDLIIPDSVTNIGNYSFLYCEGLISVTIPEYVTNIGDEAFACCRSLTSINIPNSVNTIGHSAFVQCSGLTNLTIPDSVKTIEHGTFSGCSGLTSITIPNSVTSIGDYAFSGCTALSSISIPDSVTTIGDYAFYECSSMTSVTIPNSVISIGNVAFRECSKLSSITIGNSVTYIGDMAFYYCKQIHTIFFNAVNCPHLGGFSGYNYYPTLQSLQFGDSVEHIPTGLPSFYMKNKTLIIPNSVKTIAVGALDGTCGSVVIGNGIENISTGTFPWGTSIFYATTAEPQPCESGAFANPQTLYVPAGSRIKYFTSPGWSEFANIIEGEYNPVTKIELDCDSVTLIKDSSIQLSANVLPDSATSTSIGWYSLSADVASVSDDGFVYANGVGETDIIVWVDQVSDTCHVKVTPIMVENLSLNANHLSMALNETFTLTANVSPANAENKTLEWIIPENDVLLTQQVTGTSLNIGAAGEGAVTITVRATDGSDVSATCEVFVSANTPVKSLTVSPETLNLYVGYSEQLNAIITPQDAYTQELRWMSSNTSVATVDNNGRVTGRGVGNATITAVTTDGSNLSATCAVTVTNIPVESVTLDYSEIEMYEGNSTYLYATVLPYNAMNQALRWESSNPRVATVTNYGRVNALEVGTTIITATSTDGTDISAACRVTVKNYTASNCFSMPNSEVLHGESVTIPVRLTNDQDILAFQTNIYLPEGFNMATDENDEFLIVPSSRLTNDHVLMADRLGDGGVRVICYTPQEVPISGYEGDLFYITITAPEHATHDYAINLRNSLLTNTNYQELTLPDAGAVLTVNTFMMGDANDSHSVTVTDIVVTAQYVLGRNPSPFIFEAADMNGDGEITVTDIMLIAYLINHPTMNAPKRMPALDGGNDSMSGEDVTLMADETRTVSIMLDNEMDYTAFQLDLTLPAGLIASNFQLTDRAGSHTFDVNTLSNGKTRVLCYSPAIEVIEGHEGALLTFDVTATDDIKGIITVDDIELVTTDCQTVRMNSFTIGVNSATRVNELNGAKTVARVDYFNLAGQQIDRPGSGVTLVVTTYTDGTSSTTKVIK